MKCHNTRSWLIVLLLAQNRNPAFAVSLKTQKHYILWFQIRPKAMKGWWTWWVSSLPSMTYAPSPHPRSLWWSSVRFHSPFALHVSPSLLSPPQAEGFLLPFSPWMLVSRTHLHLDSARGPPFSVYFYYYFLKIQKDKHREEKLPLLAHSADEFLQQLELAYELGTLPQGQQEPNYLSITPGFQGQLVGAGAATQAPAFWYKMRAS